MTKSVARRFSSLVVTWLALALLACTAVACGDARSVDGLDPIGQQREALFANDKACYDFFVGKGLTNFQAAGIVGNLDQESGASPTAVQPGGPGRGLAQWSAGGRWDTDAGDNLKAFAASHGGVSVWGLDIQLQFIWFELTSFSGYGLAALEATTNVHDATVVFQNKFEGCGTCVETQRVKYANDVLAAFGASTTPDYAAQFVSQSFPLASSTLTMTEGQVIPSYIELKNVGAKTWDSSTHLATTQPRDRASVFADATWVSKNRPAAVVGTVPPGGTYKFAFDLAAPATPGTYDEFFGVVQEGTAWFSDPGQGGPADNVLEVKIDVVAGSDAGASGDAGTRSDTGASIDGGDAGDVDAGDGGKTTHDAAANADGALGPEAGEGDGDVSGSIGCDVGGAHGPSRAGVSTGILFAALACLVRRRRRAGSHPN